MNSELEDVINKVTDLPPMPAVAVRVMDMMQGGNATAKGLAEAISRDASVSARILKIANSSFYSMQKQVKTLEHAIVILGEKTLRSLVFAASMQGMNKTFGLMEKMLWEDSIGCAIGARVVAMKAGGGIDPEEAFLGGLFRHIGKLVMNNMDSEKFLGVIQGVYNGEGSTMELERHYFPFSHAVIGAAVLAKWNFSEGLVMVARHHSDMAFAPEDEEDDGIYRLVAAVNIADRFCKSLGIGRREAEKITKVSQIPGAKVLGLKAADLGPVYKEFHDVFERDKASFAA